MRLSSLNVLIGPNNCGKSTVISAFRVLETAIRRARARSPEYIPGKRNPYFGYLLAEDTVPMSVENVHTDYTEEDSTVAFRLSNRSRLNLIFPSGGGVILTTETESGNPVKSAAAFRQEFPIIVIAVPVLGPLEHNEELLERDTVAKSLSSHRASRHFRNYWHYFPEGFEDFAALVRKTWSGMEISPPDPPDYQSKTITMFCEEERITRELFWAGFGFQVWCQLLTHITRSSQASILAVDEPEIYLHPDVQRQLVDILRRIGPDVVLATHSSEIISEAEPSEILIVDKRSRSAKRLTDIGEVQAALEMIGSIQNITLTHLARTRRVVFFEDEEDFSIIRKIAEVLGLHDLAKGFGITPVKSEGFGSWERVRSVGWGIEKTLGSPLRIAAVYDRDFHCKEEINKVLLKLREHLSFAHVHQRKEIENYLLEPRVLEKAISVLLHERVRSCGAGTTPGFDIVALLQEASQDEKSSLLAKYASEKSVFLRSTGVAQATIIEETSEWLDSVWPYIEKRVEILPGKDVLNRLRTIVQDRYKVTLTNTRIIRSFSTETVPDDLVSLIHALELFRTQ